MILSDGAVIEAVAGGEIDIEPMDREQLNPASYDLTLDRRMLVPAVDGSTARRFPYLTRQAPLDLRDVAAGGDYLRPVEMSPQRGYLMDPGEFLLACTAERIELGTGHAARVEGKSSLARVGLAVHVTGGFIDPGFDGQITLEMVNLMHRPLVLYAGMRIAQIAFTPVSGKVVRPYSVTGRYQGQTGPTPSRYRVAGPDADLQEATCD